MSEAGTAIWTRRGAIGLGCAALAALSGLAATPAGAQDVPPAPSDPDRRALWAKVEGERLRLANARRPGVRTLPSGLQYEVLRSGPVAGAFPGPDDKVRVHYEGTFIDGEVFDSSYQRGQPITFPVKAVIKGWQEALQLMRRGDIWRLWIPPELGYGRAGKGKVGPQETLLFKVELLDVNPTGL